MTDPIVYFEQTVLTNGIDTSEFEDVIRSLQQRDYPRVGLKPIKGRKGFYRAKTNYQGRIILTSLVLNGKTYLVVVEHLKDHKYDRSKSLNATKELNPNDFKDQIKDADSDDSEEELTSEDIALFQTIFPDSNILSFTPKKAFSVKQTYISLSECQEAVKKIPAPVIVNGLPGTGKTILLFELILDFILQNVRSRSTNSTNTHQDRVYYVAASAPFVASMRKDWQGSPSVPAGEDRVQFMSYRDFAVLQDPSLALKQEVGLREFIIWANKKEIGTLNARTIYKDLRFVSICKTFEDYKKMGVRNLHYHQPDQLQTIWNLYQDYKKSLGDKFVDWAFAEFEITQFCELLCIDEGQDLSLIQIIQLILSAKRKQFYLAMDVNQSLFLDISIRPLLQQLLAKYNYEISPANVYLRANHRMPQPIANIATLLLLIKNHLMGGTVDKQEGFALEDIQGNDKPGQVTLLIKPNPAEKKAEIRITDQKTIDDNTQYLREIAHQTNIAFIVPNETIRQYVIEKYGATQVFLAEEAKGLQWEIVVAVDMIGSSDSLDLFQKTDQALPKSADELRKFHNRPKNKDEHAQTELNSAFASPLVAISRCTKSLYIIETYSRKNVRFLDLIQQSITQPNVAVKPTERQVVTKEMWIEQIKILIANKNMNQAIRAARQELKLKVDDAITEVELLKLIELSEPKSAPSIGLTVPEHKPIKSRNSKKTADASKITSPKEDVKSGELSRAKLEKNFVGVNDKFATPKLLHKFENAINHEAFVMKPREITPLVLQGYVEGALYKGENLIKMLCDPTTIDYFNELLDSQKLKDSPISLTMLINENVINDIRAAGAVGISVLSKIFKNGKYLQSRSELERFFDHVANGVDNLNWFIQSIERVKLLLELVDAIPSLIIICLKREGHITVGSLRNSNTTIDAKRSEYVLLALEEQLKTPTRPVRQMINQQLSGVLKLLDVFSQKFLTLSAKITASQNDDVTLYSEFTQFLRMVFARRDFAKLFFMSLLAPLGNGKHTITASIFLRIIANKRLTEWLMTFLSSGKSAQESFEINFNFGCLMIKGFVKDNDDLDCIYKTSLISLPIEICELGRLLLLNNMVHPAHAQLEQAHDLENLIKINQNSAVISDPLIWMVVNLISNPQNEFIHTMRGVHPQWLSLFLKKEFNQLNLKSAILKLLDSNVAGELFKDGSIDFLNDVYDIIDLLALSGAGVFFLLDYLDYGADKDYQEKLINKLIFDLDLVRQNKLPRILINLLSKESGGLILRRVAANFPKQFQPFLNKLTQLQSSQKNQTLITFLIGQLGIGAVEAIPLHLYGTKACNYHFDYVDSRVSTAMRLILRYKSLSDHLAKKQFGSVNTDKLDDFFKVLAIPVNPHFALIYMLFYYGQKETIKELLPPHSIGQRFILFLFNHPQYIISKNMPMFKFIDEPFEHSLYYQLLPTVYGRRLIGFFFHFRTFFLGSITLAQLLVSIGHAHRYSEEGALLSLFFILSVTADVMGHEHLLKLIDTPVLSQILQNSDLHMLDQTKMFDDEQSTPYKSLQKTPTGKKVLQILLSQNPKLAEVEKSASSSYADTSTARLWQAEVTSENPMHQETISGNSYK